MTTVIRELKQRRPRRQRERQKTIGLDWQNAFWYISLPSLHDYNLKLPNFKFCGGREQKTVTFSFFSWTSIQRVRIPLQKKIANVWRIEQDEITAIKFETVRLHFCDVFAAVVA